MHSMHLINMLHMLQNFERLNVTKCIPQAADIFPSQKPTLWPKPDVRVWPQNEASCSELQLPATADKDHTQYEARLGHSHTDASNSQSHMASTSSLMAQALLSSHMQKIHVAWRSDMIAYLNPDDNMARMASFNNHALHR